MKKLILICFLFFISCDKTKVNSISDVQKIKVGMSENEVKYILGEPRDVEIQNGYTELDFIYEAGGVYNHWFNVMIVNGKVNNFQTY